MAVIQISKIQVRRGLEENLPQLASGELGWSIDSQRLYIGNGTTDEGAPEIGNTEIVTIGRDILSALKSYTFKGRESTYTSQTGASILIPVQRYFQDKLDDQISLRDFITDSDVTSGDYTVALQRAVDQVFPKDYYSTVGVRRVLHVPAGTWPITSNITIPPYATIVGDGARSTIIKQTIGGGSTNPVIRFRDSRGNLGATINTTTSDAPFQIVIKDLTLQTEIASNDVALIESSQMVTFEKVRFQGNVLTPVNFGSNVAGVRLLDTVTETKNITFDRCEFVRSNYGIVATGNISAISVTNSLFDTLYRGIYANVRVGSPQGIKVTSSLFDNIAKQAIVSADSSSITSAFNLFDDVGYGDASTVVTATPSSTVLSWNNPNNCSIGDIFKRSSTDQTTSATIEILSNTVATLTQTTTAGSVTDSTGGTLTLLDSTTANTSVVLTTRIPSAIIDYRITRGTLYRVGTMHVSQYNGTVVFDDEYSETSSLGVTLSFIGNTTANTATLNYVTTSSSSTNATLKYTIRSFV